MKITKLTLMYYQFKRVPRLGKHTFKFGYTIHEVLNRQCDFKSDIKHHNDIQYLRLIYSNYKRGSSNREEFLAKLSKRNYINRYLSRFN